MTHILFNKFKILSVGPAGKKGTLFECLVEYLLCSHSNGDLFTREDNMLFLHVKISCFRAKAHLVFHGC